MASNTRSGRRTAVSNTSSAQLDVSILSNIERLLLAQAVHEVGANAWSSVSKILSKHPLLSRPKSFFNAQVGSYFLFGSGVEVESGGMFSQRVYFTVMPCNI
jgi:hypothetical protein